MKIDIYRSALNNENYLSVPAGTDLAKTPLPQTLDPDLLKISSHDKNVDINPGDNRIALDSNDVIEQIKAKGYATHTAKVTVTISSEPSPPFRK